MWTVLLVLAAAPEVVTHRVTGLFSPEREADLREAVSRLEGVELLRVDVERAEADFSYDPAQFFKGVKEGERLKRFDQLLRQASHHTFGVRVRGGTPWERLKEVEIAVAGLDCRGCELAVYETVVKIEGVEQATASLKEGRVRARIDPAKTSREALVAALKKRQVTVREP